MSEKMRDLLKKILAEESSISDRTKEQIRQTLASAGTLEDQRSAYWKANLSILGWCLGVWFIAGYLLPIFMVDALNTMSIGGYPLGFWMAQQGSIYTFLVLIFFYAWWMNRLDKKFDVHEE